MSGGREIMRALGTPGLTHAEARVYAYYVGRANGARLCWPGIDETSRDLDDMPGRTIMAANRRLVELGRLRVERRYKDTSHYFILDPDGRIFGEQKVSDVQKTAPQVAPSDLQETAPQTSDLQNSAPQKNSHLRRKKPLSDLQKTVSESKTQESLKKDSRQRRTRAREKPIPMPVDWEPTDEDRAYATAHGRNPDLCRDDLRNYWPETGIERPGWSRTYRQFVLRCESQDRYPLQSNMRLFRTAKPSLHEEWNLPTFCAPIFDDDEEPSNVRRIAP